MRNLNYLLVLAVAVFSFSCSSEDETPKLVEKSVTIEVEMDGNYDDYLVTFSVHSMLSGTSTFVAPVLDQPTELNWTQVIEQGNTYTLSFEPEVPIISAISSAPIHSLGLVFNAVHLGGETTDSFQPISATVNVLADGEVYRQFEYEALPPGEVSVPLAEEITFQ
ncbi:MULTISPECIES: hypothetical protein [Algoriphagus]|jgi:hypothetical protein|uniref:Uncharacterized protein n=1 Tax=Algoriphagus boritolerans DSM 17298 = JCM 18970 TaxID=1120964 RepID=A0A1H5UB31_9BACT|nr:MULTISPECIES: hypothetical protein [Algoriphagus]MBS4070495.1 hypothetical protein [Algoriphagus sp.]MDP2040862.1 hypothetical protein [Algoriphagus sp.]MDP3471727.1 hypothetical protein [Algoriphagus sp.]SEF72246.1 hypothetical protein SAMN03080598_01158 [Algoriphagus boritolerans DSM 17298 = JCM 18970]